MIQAGSRSLPEGRRGVRWVARAIGFALLGIAAVAGATVGLEAQGRQPLTGRVVRVMDGDTIAVRVDKRVFTVRYIGTNTRDARMPGDSVDAGPTEAAEFNRALVLGQTVRLEMDAQEKDAQGRLLAYVYVGDLMVNAELVANGYAEVAIKPPNVMHEEMLQQLQRQARLLKVGRWRDSPYVGREPGSRRAGAPPKQSASAGDPKTAPAGRTFGTVDRPGAAPHDAWTCPISHPVKGAVNPSNTGERLYHLPGGEAYAKTQPERCYANAEEAREDGTRRAQR
jgi:micrococcal nuclease